MPNVRLTLALVAALLWTAPACDRIERINELAKRGQALSVYSDARQMYESGDRAGATEKLHQLVQENDQTDAMVNNAYALWMDQAGRGAESLPSLAQFVAESRNTEVTDSLFRAHFLSQGIGDERAWQQRYDSLAARSITHMMDRVKPSMTDSRLADFVLTDTHGNVVALSSLRGKVVVLDFWATWCGPCISSFPGMQRVMRQTDSDNVHFLYVNTMERGDALTKARDFLAQNGYEFHTVIDQGSKLAEAYRVRGIPTKIIVGPDGRAKFRKVGHNPNPMYAEKELMAMIALARGD